MTDVPDETRVHMPRVTVVIPTYNYSAVLRYSVATVLEQTVDDFELLVVGDGCTDDSEDVVLSIGDPRVQWLNLPRNTGHQVGPNNEGLRRARAEFVAYLGHDDLWLPNHLELLLHALEGGAAVAHGLVLHAGPGKPCFTTPEPGWSYQRGDWIAPTSMAIRRSLAVRVGGWRLAARTEHEHSDPEAELVARLFDVAGAPTLVPRITSVKLPASQRRNVYRARPTHEQAYWLEQIRSRDPEGAVTAHVGTPYLLAGDPVAPPLLTRAWYSARFRVRRRLGLETQIPANTAIRRRHRFSGAPWPSRRAR